MKEAFLLLVLKEQNLGKVAMRRPSNKNWGFGKGEENLPISRDSARRSLVTNILIFIFSHHLISCWCLPLATPNGKLKAKG